MFPHYLALDLQAWLSRLQHELMQPSQTAPPIAPEFIWTQLLTALVVGLLTALAFQLLLTNLGVAIGISLWRIRKPPQNSSEGKEQSESSGIGTLAGFGILLTVNTVLFSACFLATKFSQVTSPISGAIAGIVIWSAYFLLLIWISSRAVGSLVGSLLDITTGGFRRIVSAIAAAFNKNDSDDSSLSEEQVVATVRQEMQAMFNTIDLRQIVEEQLEQQLQAISQLEMTQWQLKESETLRAQREALTANVWQEIDTYLSNTSTKSLTSKRIDRKVKTLLLETQQEHPNDPFLPTFNQAQLDTILEQHSKLTDKQKSRIAGQIATSWQEFLQSYLGDRSTVKSESSEKPRLPAQVTAKVLQSALNATLEQVFGLLPNLLQQVGIKMPNLTELAPIILSIALAKLRDSFGSDALNVLGLDNSELKSELKQNLDRWLNPSQSELTHLNQALLSPVKYLRDRSLEQVESIQQAAQEQITTIKQKTQQRVEDTRKAAAAAAWWLFLTASTGAISSAIAGALATGLVIR